MSPLKVALGALAVIVVFVTGFAVLGRPSGLVGGVAAPTASPSPSPTASPVPLPQGTVEGGTYRLQPYLGEPLTVDADVPAGWTGFESWALIGPADSGAPAGVGIAFVHADSIFSDPCHWDLAGNGVMAQPGDVAVGPTVDDLANALHANTAYTSTAPVPVTIGGHAAKQLVLQVPPELDLETCDPESGDPQGRWAPFGGKNSGLNAQGPGNRWTVSIIDAGGTRLIAVLLDYAATPQQMLPRPRRSWTRS